MNILGKSLPSMEYFDFQCGNDGIVPDGVVIQVPHVLILVYGLGLPAGLHLPWCTVASTPLPPMMHHSDSARGKTIVNSGSCSLTMKPTHRGERGTWGCWITFPMPEWHFQSKHFGFQQKNFGWNLFDFNFSWKSWNFAWKFPSSTSYNPTYLCTTFSFQWPLCQISILVLNRSPFHRNHHHNWH